MNIIYRFSSNPFLSWNRLTIVLIGILLIIVLSSCATMPSPGDHLVMVITRIPTQRQDLQNYPGLSLALNRGVTREDVKSGRLVTSGCYDEKEINSPGTGRRFGYSFIPKGVTLDSGDIIEVVAEEAVGKHFEYARFFGRYLKKCKSSETDYFPYKYSVSGKGFRCGPVSHNGVMKVEVYSTAKYWDYDLVKAEALRNDQIGEKELEQRRIAIGECSPGVDSWAIWKVRIPAGLKVEVGDYIEAIAGSYEAPRSFGPISEVIQKVATPPKKDFILTQGRYTVDCKARAKPIIKNH